MSSNLSASMNVRVMGSGKDTIVLAHGYGTDQSIWDKVVPYLSILYRVVVFDWCFSGVVKDRNLYDPDRYSCYESFADDLISLVDELKLESLVFVGHSMSGMIGCIASLKRPDLFQRLVLVGPSPRYLNHEDYEGGYEMADIEQIFSSIDSNFEEWASNFSPIVVDSVDPLSVKKIEDCLIRMCPKVALSLAKTVFLSDYRHILSRVVTPCNIIQTRNDVVVPDSVPKYMQNQIKGECEVDVIDSTEGHYPQFTAHIEFLEVINNILGD